MESSVKGLSKYRLERAREDLKIAKDLLETGDYRFSTNRSYYAIFHAMRAVHALGGFDSKKHSGVIGHFNYEYVRTGIFPKEVTSMIKGAMEIRQSSDYEDFYIASKTDAVNQVKDAEYIVGLVEEYLKGKLET